MKTPADFAIFCDEKCWKFGIFHGMMQAWTR